VDVSLNHDVMASVSYLEAGAWRNKGEGSDGSASWKFWQEAQERTSISQFFGTVPMIPKILGTAKTDKAKESVNTKPRLQLSFCQLNFTKISSFIRSVVL
jgi:hypothetical protein